MNLTLTRLTSANGAVVGRLDGLSKTLYTLEDEWKGNQPRVSCIPPGTYQVKPHGWGIVANVRFPQTWEVMKVPNRSAILLHAGNTIKDTEGCILVGQVMSISQLQSRVDDSRLAIDFMRREIGEREFTLTIR